MIDGCTSLLLDDGRIAKTCLQSNGVEGARVNQLLRHKFYYATRLHKRCIRLWREEEHVRTTIISCIHLICGRYAQQSSMVHHNQRSNGQNVRDTSSLSYRCAEHTQSNHLLIHKLTFFLNVQRIMQGSTVDCSLLCGLLYWWPYYWRSYYTNFRFVCAC